MKDLTNKKILFIICGGISAYKSLETIRLFKKNNAEIKTNSLALLVKIVFISALFFFK